MANADEGKLLQVGALRDGQGPVAFKDVPVPGRRREHDDDDAVVSAMPARITYGVLEMRRCGGFWVMERWARTLVAMQRGFVARPAGGGGGGDVVLASLPKAGTTWLKALAFAAMARRAWPPPSSDHPLRHRNPHDCVPFVEDLFEQGLEAVLDVLPSPRLLATHMPLSLLLSSMLADSKIVYICRDEKDRAVSLWHFLKRVRPDMSFPELYESCCDGTNVCGPSWNHILEYWNASMVEPSKVLFLTYENVLQHPWDAIRKLARFVGQPFSDAEEEAGVVGEIAGLCSLESMRRQEANKEGSQGVVLKFSHDSYFRKGAVGDWVNHMTSEMGEHLDAIFREKLHGSGLSI